MIIIKLSGGMGNQLFQYAFGCIIATRLDAKMKMDLSFYDHQPVDGVQRAYALGVFNVKENFAEAPVARPTVEGTSLWARARRKLASTFRRPVPPIYHEHGLAYEEAVFSAPDGTCFDGYWQSELYFSSIGDEIRHAFTLNDGLSPRGQQIEAAMRAEESVSLHVRRGDYVQSATTNAVHGTCTPEYYAKAIAHVAAYVTAPHFYVFSDDIEWVKANLPIDHPVTWVSDGVLKDYEELALMASCRHNIIANSSFSWWGAWLNDNPSKVVIAPARWFAKGDLDTRDLIPETWVKI